MKKLLTIILPLCLAMAACQPIEMSARDAVAAAKGYLDSARVLHPECATNSLGANCAIIAHGVAAKDTVINALHIYCASDSYEAGGPCTPHKDAQASLKEALSNLNRTMADVKRLVGVK